MIEFEQFIYLDVNRTGSTHVIDLLKQIVDGPVIRLWRHAPITRGGLLVRPARRLVFTTVRNPWDWYVSLWAHGAGGKSAIRRFMLAKLPKSEVLAFYDTSDPRASFRRWLAAVHDPSFADEIMGEGYPRSRLSSLMGLYTYRFQRVTTRYPWFFLRRWRIGAAEAISRFHHRRKAYHTILRTETLTTDLAALVQENRERCQFKSNAAEIIHAADNQRKNASPRDLEHYRDYYDDGARKIVETRDRFFMDEFGYTFH